MLGVLLTQEKTQGRRMLGTRFAPQTSSTTRRLQCNRGGSGVKDTVYVHNKDLQQRMLFSKILDTSNTLQ